MLGVELQVEPYADVAFACRHRAYGRLHRGDHVARVHATPQRRQAHSPCRGQNVYLLLRSELRSTSAPWPAVKYVTNAAYPLV